MKVIESQAHSANQIYWQDIPQSLNADSTDAENFASNWTSPDDFFKDEIRLKFGGKRGTGGLEGISEVLSAGDSRSYLPRLPLTPHSAAELKIELLSEHIENGETDTSKASRNS
jgi:hypothetical protein